MHTVNTSNHVRVSFQITSLFKQLLLNYHLHIDTFIKTYDTVIHTHTPRLVRWWVWSWGGHRRRGSWSHTSLAGSAHWCLKHKQETRSPDDTAEAPEQVCDSVRRSCSSLSEHTACQICHVCVHRCVSDSCFIRKLVRSCSDVTYRSSVRKSALCLLTGWNLTDGKFDHTETSSLAASQTRPDLSEM